MDRISIITAFTCTLPLLVACDTGTGDRDFESGLGRPHDLSLGSAADKAIAEPIRPLPLALEHDRGLALLGEKLYHDKRLSGDQSLSCASCHMIDQGGDDNRAASVGIGGAVGPINAPTTLNATFNLAQLWDGRAADLQEQAGGPVNNPMEMGSNWEEVIPRLQADADYVAEFAEHFPDGISADNITFAIAEFERTLVTPSAFDRYLRGDTMAISEQAKHGYQLFKDYGCVSCHQGINVGGNMFQKFGALVSYYEDKAVAEVDKGRMAVTRSAEDRFVFKVPSLRNAARTAPYFHNAAAATLPDAIRIMAHTQLGKALPDADVASIEQFIVSLNGEVIGP